MRLLYLWTVLLCPALASAGDLAKLDRTIKKEPAYTGNPKYCLLVFGPEAKNRVWLVLDGDTLFVDRNCNGDLTDPGERLTPTDFKKVVISVPQDPPPMERDFEIGDIVEEGTKARHTSLKVNHRRWRDQNDYGASVLVNGKHAQVVGIPFSERPSNAPIAYFNGPLTMGRWGRLPSLRPGGTIRLHFVVGIKGLGTFTTINYEPIPESVFPVAEFTFQNRDPRRPPMKAKVILNHRC
jgi:hypothetical protein